MKQNPDRNKRGDYTERIKQLQDAIAKDTERLLEYKADQSYRGRGLTPNIRILERRIKDTQAILNKMLRLTGHTQNGIDEQLRKFLWEVKSYQGGMPDDQLGADQWHLVERFPDYFENDGGYIKLKPIAKKLLSMERNPRGSRTPIENIIERLEYYDYTVKPFVNKIGQLRYNVDRFYRRVITGATDKRLRTLADEARDRYSDHAISKAREHGQVNPRSANPFTWSKNAHNYALLQDGKAVGYLTYNSGESYTVSASRGGNKTFRATSLAKAKAEALNFIRHEFPHLQAYRKTQPSVKEVNEIVKHTEYVKHGKVIRVDPAGGFDNDKYIVGFEDGTEFVTKIPKVAVAFENPRRRAKEYEAYCQTCLHNKVLHKGTKRGANEVAKLHRELYRHDVIVVPLDAATVKEFYERANPRKDINAVIGEFEKHGYSVKWHDKRGRVSYTVFTEKGIPLVIGATEEYLRKLSPANPLKNRKRNDYDAVDFFDDRVDQISAEFTGEISGNELELEAPDGTPKKLARLGHLRLVKIRDGNNEYDIKFGDNEDAYLAADRRKNLYFVGRDANAKGIIKLPKKGQKSELGQVIQIDYFTTKRHIESGKPTYFYHELGEVDGFTPVAYIDSEGFITLYGGNYDIWPCGIVN